jgi:hypothetical protein
MGHAVGERRLDARFTGPTIGRFRATVRPGCLVTLVNLSGGGALIHSSRPLRPGARIHLQLATATQAVGLAAHVQRCTVALLDPDGGVTYSGALKFDERCEIPWEETTHRGHRVPASARTRAADHGDALPARMAAEGRNDAYFA